MVQAVPLGWNVAYSSQSSLTEIIFMERVVVSRDSPLPKGLSTVTHAVLL